MKKHISRHLGLAAGLTGIVFAASLQAEPFTPTIEATADVASNYVFRGADVYQNKFAQDGKAYGSFNAAPALQPSLTFKFAEGWSLNAWGSFAMVGRKDKDTDGFYQNGPGGADQGLVSALAAGTTPNLTTITSTAYTASAVTVNDLLGRPAGKYAPGFYKEQNGLGRADEIDLTLSYNVSTKLGTMTGGVISYNYPNIVQQTATNLELFGGFAPAFLPELSLTVYIEGASPTPGAGSMYDYLAYTKDIEISKDTKITIAPGVGYATSTSQKIAGVKNVNLPITLTLGGFHVGVTGVYRPTLAFFETDTARGSGASLYGGSTMTDGLVADPAKNNGLMNAVLNQKITTAIGAALPAGTGITYTYTPRASLPKSLVYFTAGYTAAF